MARERFKEGVQYFDLKQYDKARAAFLQAYALKRHPAVLLNLAQSELRSQYEADAAKHFSQYLREQNEGTGSEKESAESGLMAAKAHAAELKLSIDEDGAQITIDGVAEGLSPLPGPIYLKPGTRMIVARKEGREASLQLNALAGHSTSTVLRLRSPAVAQAEVKPGDYELRKDAPPPSADVLSRDDSASSSFEPTREGFFEWARRSPVAWAGGALGALGLGGGLTFWVVSKQNYSDADSIASQIRDEAIDRGDTSQGICRMPSSHYQAACELYTETVGKGDDYRTVSWASLGVSAFALTGTVVYYFATTGGESAPQSAKVRPNRIVPWLGPGAQGVSIAGEF